LFRPPLTFDTGLPQSNPLRSGVLIAAHALGRARRIIDPRRLRG
jgi:hypothetical protein